MIRGLLARVAVVGLLALAACGGDDRTATPDDTPEDTPTSSSTSPSSATNEGTEWCEDLAALLEPDDLTPAVIAGAPDEIRDDLEALHEASDTDPVGPLLEAQAAVESWGHDRCGGDHPFCSLWITYTGAVAAWALTEADPEEIEEVVDEMDDALLHHVPAEELSHLRTALESLEPPLSDAGERAAEAAYDALDEWAWSEGCEGAQDPADDD